MQQKWLPGVPDTGESFFFFWDFFSNFKSLTLTLKQQPIYSFDSCFKIFPNFIISVATPGVPDTGESS